MAATSSKIMSGLDKLISRRRNESNEIAELGSQIGDMQMDQSSEKQQNERIQTGTETVINTGGGPTSRKSGLSQSDEGFLEPGTSGGFTQSVGFGASTDQNKAQYKHWNVFFKDIYRVSIDIVDRDTNKVISQQDLERIFAGGEQNNQAQAAAGGRQEAANGAQGA